MKRWQRSLRKIDVEGVKVKIIHTGVGAITESDIILASASNAIVIGFNVRPDVNAKRTAELENVDIRLHRIIYKVIEEIEANYARYASIQNSKKSNRSSRSSSNV